MNSNFDITVWFPLFLTVTTGLENGSKDTWIHFLSSDFMPLLVLLWKTLWRLRWLNPILRGQTECLWWCLNIITWCNFLDVPVQEWDHPDHYKPGHLTPIHLNQTFKGLRHQSFQFFHKQDVGTSVPAETTKGPSSPLNLQKCQSILGHWLSILWFIVFFLAWEMHWRKLV